MAKVTRYYAITHDSEDSDGFAARDIEKILHVDNVEDVTEHVLAVAVSHSEAKAEIVDHDGEGG